MSLVVVLKLIHVLAAITAVGANLTYTYWLRYAVWTAIGSYGRCAASDGSTTSSPRRPMWSSRLQAS